MLVKAFRYIRVITIVPLTWLIVSCGQGDGTETLLAPCTTTVADVDINLSEVALVLGKAEITVADSCLPLKSSKITVSDGTESVDVRIDFDATGTALAVINFGTTSASTASLSVALADTITVSYTDSNDAVHMDTAVITADFGLGVYSETNIVASIPVAEFVERVPGGKITSVNSRSQAVALYDGRYMLEADYDTSEPGAATNGFILEFGPTRTQNSSFEAPDASAADVSCSADWDCFNSSFTVGTGGPVAHTGTQVLKQYGNDGGTQQSIAVEAGDVVSATVQVMSWDVDALKSSNLGLMQLAFFDAANNEVGKVEKKANTEGTEAYTLTAQDGDSPDDWTEMEITAVVPPGAVRANLLLLHIQIREFYPGGPFLTPGGAIFWDDAIMSVEPSSTGEDVSSYEVLRFAMETASLAGIADLKVELKDTNGASAGVYISAYTATASPDVAGWSTYEIALGDFAGVDLSRLTSLAFLDASSTLGAPATLVDATLYFDDISFVIGTALPPAPAPLLTGMLVNSAIEGVTYQTPTQSGVTNAAGEFEYIEGETVTFTIGDIDLGSVSGADVISPVELTGSLDPTAQAVINMLVFLQTIDDNEDHTDGISISAASQVAAVGQTLDFNQSSSAFNAALIPVVNALTDPDHAIVSESDALDNFYDTYAALNGTDTFNWLFPGYAAVGQAGFDLVWSDEFNSGTVPSAYWVRETGYGDNGWGNNEWQNYTDDAANLSVANGYLNISVQCAPAAGETDCSDLDKNKRTGTITSARIKTQDNFAFKYGVVKARLKTPSGDGTWPAFWMLGANFPTIGWPAAGEIDIMEMAPARLGLNTAGFAMHWNDGGLRSSASTLSLDDPLTDDFHVYEARWDENGITGYIDGVQYFTRDIDASTMDEFLKEFFLLLNVAAGGDFSGVGDGQSGTMTTVFPQTMLVDYVRVYQPTGGNGTSTVTPPGSTVSGLTTTLDVSDASSTAGTPITVTVVAKDSNGIDIPVSAGTVELFSTDAVAFGPVIDSGSGSYTATVNSNSVKTVIISGTIAGNPISATQEITFTPGDAAVGRTTIKVEPATVESDGMDASIVTVTLKDQFGNDTTTISGALDVVATMGGAMAMISSPSDIGGGVYTASVTNTVAEQVTISGTIDGNAITDSKIITFTVGAVSGLTTTIDEAAPGDVVADGVSTRTIEIQARDGTNNIIDADVGAVMLITTGQTSGAVSTPFAASYSGSNGLYTATITSTVAEVVTVSGSIAGNTITDTADVNFIAGAFSGAGTTIDASYDSAVSNGISTVTVTVTVADQFGNVIGVDQGDIISLSKGASSAVLSGVTNHGDGTYTATVTDATEEDVTISGTIDSGPAAGMITDVTVISFAPALALYSDTSVTSVQGYTGIIDTASGCKLTTVTEVPDATLASHEGSVSLQADYTSAGAGGNCNGFAFGFEIPAGAAIPEYDVDWEANLPDWETDLTAVSDEGFVIGQLNVTTTGQWFVGAAAPNNIADGNNGFSSLVTGEGGAEQGDIQLSVYADYNSFGPWGTNTSWVVTSYVLNDLGTITADMVNNTYRFSFDAKLGNLDASVADADVVLKVLKQSDMSFFELANLVFDSDANLTTDWSSGSLDVTIDAGMVGELLQFSFSNTTDNYNPSGVYYDNLRFTAVPADISARTRMSFAINTTAAATLMDLEVRLEDADGATASVFLSDYIGQQTVINGDWYVYDILLSDFVGGADLSRLVSVGFYDASSTLSSPNAMSPSVTLIDGMLYIDDVHFID